jgi:serine phosphatase RsbU (regulator of sigma subunit)
VVPDRAESAGTIISRINKELLNYTKGAPPADDVTLIVARRIAA